MQTDRLIRRTRAGLQVAVAVADAWRRIVLRRWHVELSQVVLMISVPAVMVRAMAPAGTAEPAHLTVTFLLSLVAAAGMPSSPAGSRLIDSVRMDLLPVGRKVRLALRLLLLNPLRGAVALSAAVFAGTALLRQGGSWHVHGLEALQMLSAAAVTVCFADGMDSCRSRLRWLPVQGALVMSGTAALLLLFHEPGTAAAAEMLSGWAGDTWLLGSSRVTAAELAMSGAAVACALVSVPLAASLQPHRSRQPSSAQLLSNGRDDGTRRLLPTSAPALALKEAAVIARHPRLLLGLAWPAASTTLALTLGVPLLIPAGCALWALNTLNLLGPDLPSGGLHRYALLPGGLHSVVRARHVAFATALFACIGVVWTVVWALGAVRVPQMGAPTRWMYAVSAVYGLSLQLPFAFVSRRMAMDWPHWFDPSARLRIGDEPPVFVMLPVLLMVAFVIVVGLAAGGGISFLTPHWGAAHRTVVLLGTASLAHVVVWLACRRWSADE